MNVKFKKFSEDAQIPKYMTSGSAGFDIASLEDITILPNQVVAVKTGFGLSFDKDYELQIRSRSGLSLNRDIIVNNAPATIDSDYTEEIKVILRNNSKINFRVSKGDRIAQGVFSKVEIASFEEVDELESTERKGGFGSTGI